MAKHSTPKNFQEKRMQNKQYVETIKTKPADQKKKLDQYELKAIKRRDFHQWIEIIRGINSTRTK